MTLVPLAELLTKYGLSRATYHNLLNKGFLPHYAKRHGEPGKKGARYLYDAEAFDAAWAKYKERTGKGVGIDVVERDQKFERMENLPKHQQIDLILQDFPVLDGESLTDYDARVTARRGELAVMPEEVVKEMALKLVRQGFKHKDWV